MGRSRLSLKRSLLLSAVFSLSLFTAGVLADTTTDVATSADAATTTADAATTTAEAATTTAAATTTSDDATTTTSASSTESSSTTADDSTTATTSTSDSASASDMPSISSASSADTSIPTYPAPTVPPLDNAPYMQTSNLPDGTVFICVGAILGAAFLAVLLWRGLTAFLLHRSVEKAAMAQHLANDKASFPIPPGPFYGYSDQDSSQNIASGRGVRRTTRGPIPSSTPSQSNLFFSPTAGTPNRESVYRSSEEPNRNSTYRDSRFLPAGFYAAGGSPQNTDGHGQSISLTNLRPDSRGHALSGHTPPESPGYGPQRARHSTNMSTSSINLNNSSQARAPSAFLDDLLDEHPEAFPPSGPSPNPRSHANHPYRQSGGRY